MRRFSLGVATLVLIVLISALIGGESASTQDRNGLEFVDDSAVSFFLPHDWPSDDHGRTIGTKPVTIANTSDEPMRAAFCVVTTTSQNGCGDTPVAVSLENGDGTIAANDVATLNLEFSWNAGSPFTKTSGYLVLTSGPGAPISTRPVAVTQQRSGPLSDSIGLFDSTDILATFIISASAVVAIVTILAVILYRTRKGPNWQAPEISDPTFTFKDSWATALTTLGGILGTLLSAGFIPAQTQVMPKNTLIGLNVLFPLLILIAPMIYNVLRQDIVVEGKKVTVGRIWAFWVMGALTLWAVMGQFLTVLVVMEEIYQQQVFPAVGYGVLLAIVAGAAILLFVHVIRQSAVLSAPKRVDTEQRLPIPRFGLEAEVPDSRADEAVTTIELPRQFHAF